MEIKKKSLPYTSKPSKKHRKKSVIKRSLFGNYQREGKWKHMCTTGWNLSLSAILKSNITVFSVHMSDGPAILLLDINSNKDKRDDD